MTHEFIGKHPQGRTGMLCRILDRSRDGRFAVVVFADGKTEACRVNHLRLRPSPASTTVCVGCGDAGVHLSLVEGLCSDCRSEQELLGECDE